MHVSCHPLHRLRALLDIAPTCLGYLGCLGCNLLEEFCRIGEWTKFEIHRNDSLSIDVARITATIIYYIACLASLVNSSYVECNYECRIYLYLLQLQFHVVNRYYF